MDQTQNGQGKVEIAYMAFGRDDRLVPKRKIVDASKLEKTLEKLREDVAMNMATCHVGG